MLILLLIAIQVKHFLADFPLQATPYMYANKGRYGHLGGIIHAAIHGIGTTLVFCWFDVRMAFVYGLVDFVLHYHIDWVKMSLGKKLNLKPDNSEWFWILLGYDQFLHQLTYIGLIACMTLFQ